MTLPPERIGYKGQQYEARYFDVDDDQEEDMPRVIGWAPTWESAQRLADSWKLRPSTACAWVIDLNPDEPVNECSREPTP